MQTTAQTHELSEIEWQAATAVSQSLVKGGMDENELRKAIAYLRTIKHQAGAGKQFFSYLTTLVKQGEGERGIGHSKKTKGYYEGLVEVCDRFLKAYQEDAPALDRILSWAARLMKYYKNAGPIGEITAPEFESQRQLEVAQARASAKAEIGDRLEAVVTAISKKVSYELPGGLKFSNKEPKCPDSLKVGQTVTVEVTRLDDDGGIKKIKRVD